SLDEQRSHFGLFRFRRPPPPVGAAPVSPGVDVRTASQQMLHPGWGAAACGCHEQRLAVRRDGLRAGASIEQTLDHLAVAICGGERERRDTVTIGTIRVRACPKQEVSYIGGVATHTPGERRGSVNAGSLDVRGGLSQ